MTGQLKLLVQRTRFRGSAAYWDRRYRDGGNSGAGSYGDQATYKAEFLNRLVDDHNIETVVEFGCGDGNQLALARYPRYLGLDVSPTAVAACISQFADDTTKSFALYDGGLFHDPAGFIRADLSMSLDVVYHLIEDSVFDRYMRHLFAAAARLVVVYATDREMPRQAGHVHHRQFSSWIEQNAPEWRLLEKRDRPTVDCQDFFVYSR